MTKKHSELGMIPAGLALAIRQPKAGRVVLVLGAGCSFEAPTGIPLARDCSVTAFHALVNDRILDGSECDPEDLSELADVVFAKTGGQRELVSRFPVTIEHFKTAAANEGYLIAAALMAEGAIQTILTLNYDDGLLSAVRELDLSKNGSVSTVLKPADFRHTNAKSIFYLHRHCSEDPDAWILRKTELETAWRDGWEMVVAARVLANPEIVFAGLGSPAAVLTETVSKIQARLPKGCSVYQVDPSDYGKSGFTKELKIEEPNYIAKGWCSFMKELSGSYLEAYLRGTLQRSSDLSVRMGWASENIGELLRSLQADGLVAVGKIRAKWLMHRGRYLASDDFAEDPFVELLRALAQISRLTGTEVVFNEVGYCVLNRNGVARIIVVPLAGRGTYEKSLMELQSKDILASARKYGAHAPAITLMQGPSDGPADIQLPVDISGEDASDSIAWPGVLNMSLSTQQLRSDEAIITGIVGNV